MKSIKKKMPDRYSFFLQTISYTAIRYDVDLYVWGKTNLKPISQTKEHIKDRLGMDTTWD